MGHVLPVPKTDQHSQNIAQMIAQIDISIAGRVGEELHHDFVSEKIIPNFDRYFTFLNLHHYDFLADGQLRTNQQILPRSGDLIRHANWAYYSEIL